MNSILGYRKMIDKTQKDVAKILGISEQTKRKKEKGLKDVSIEDIFFT